MKIAKEKLDDLSRKANELKTLQVVFSKFSDDRWTKEGELLRRLQNVEASAQHLNKENTRLQAEHAKVHQTAVQLAMDKEDLSKAAVKLTFMLDEVRVGYKNLERQYNQAVAQMAAERNAKTA